MKSYFFLKRILLMGLTLALVPASSPCEGNSIKTFLSPRSEFNSTQDHLAALFHQYLSSVKVKKSRHFENRGGTHFSTYLYEGIPLVEKIPHKIETMAAALLTQNRIMEFSAKFVVFSEPNKMPIIYQESIPSLERVLKLLVSQNKFEEGLPLLEEFMKLNLEIIKRGVINWDCGIDNYGVDPNGKLVLIDFGGIETTEDFMSEDNLYSEEGDVSRFYLSFGKNLPKEYNEAFSKLQNFYGFGNGGAIVKTVGDLMSLSMDPELIELTLESFHFNEGPLAGLQKIAA